MFPSAPRLVDTLLSKIMTYHARHDVDRFEIGFRNDYW